MTGICGGWEGANNYINAEIVDAVGLALGVRQVTAVIPVEGDGKVVYLQREGAWRVGC